MNSTHAANVSLRSRGRASLLILLYVVLMALAASPALHEVLHADAKNTDHHCAITVLTQGHVDVPICDVSASPVLISADGAPLVVYCIPVRVLNLLPPGRAPPYFFS